MAKYIDQHLRNSLKALMRVKKLDDITVVELVEYAQVNRKTFYNHFGGITGLIIDIMVNAYEDSVDDQEDILNWENGLHSMMETFQENSEFCNAVFHSQYRTEIVRVLQSKMLESTEKFIDSVIALMEKEDGKRYNISRHHKNYLIRYYASIMYTSIEEWFMNGMEEPIETIITLIDKLNGNGIYAGIEYFASIN